MDGAEAERDVKRYLRSLPDSLLKNELDKLLEHCKAVIREGGAYVTHWRKDFTLSQTGDF